MKLMVLGTSSNAGKTLLSAIFCRYLTDKGVDTVPFKGSNLSLNSVATRDGKEIGIGQAFQAMACCKEPTGDMNPILLKPSGKGVVQVITNGRPYEKAGNDLANNLGYLDLSRTYPEQLGKYDYDSK